MAEQQVRRVPIVDGQGRLVGIIAQADIALHSDEEQVGEMVEEISQPYGSGSWSEGRAEAKERGGAMSGVSALTVGAICVGVGASLMYLFDPSRGRRRRAMLRDKATSYAGSSAGAVKRTSEDLRNRATGAYMATRSKLSREQVSDEKLVERVRSKMGRCLANPHAVDVRAHEGHVTLTGPVLAEEAHELVSCVRAIPGVHSLENLLEVHDWSENHPLLRHKASGSSGWGPGMRLLSGAVGGGMMLYGLRSRSTAGKASASLGLGLLTRGITNREFGRLGEIANLRS
jgi:osmotically-inducible protein OsmY